jgi:hypothetical protein
MSWSSFKSNVVNSQLIFVLVYFFLKYINISRGQGWKHTEKGSCLERMYVLVLSWNIMLLSFEHSSTPQRSTIPSTQLSPEPYGTAVRRCGNSEVLLPPGPVVTSTWDCLGGQGREKQAGSKA